MIRLGRFRKAVKLLRTIHPQLRVSQVDILLSIAAKEGQSQTDLAADCELSVAAISRAIDVLGSAGRRDGKGGKLGLIRVEKDPQDDRFQLVYLTDRGKNVMQLFADLVYGEK
jgi:DNA-binding MarR family transcriptional regulator